MSFLSFFRYIPLNQGNLLKFNFIEGENMYRILLLALAIGVVVFVAINDPLKKY